MKPEKQNLIHELLNDDSSREAALTAGTRILRRRRHWRAARRGAALVALVGVITMFCLRKETSRPSSSQISSATPKAQPAAQIQALSDDELLALFPNTPVGLASLSDGKKRLVFPRPGDEQRFITRL